ncbi:hypothetical protein TNCV_4249201 [Trichonephila clavipes]|nr:hypothetical protein TNCV_4249201 [Trichonephila clavipes]
MSSSLVPLKTHRAEEPDVRETCRGQCSTVVWREAKSEGKTEDQIYSGKFSCVIRNKQWLDLEGEKDSNDDLREKITDFVQSIQGFRECDEEDIEIWMTCDA